MREGKFIPYDSESGPPLPLHKDLWKDLLPNLRKGFVAIEDRDNPNSWRDTYYAAMPEIIDALYDEVIANFQRPTLEVSGHGFALDFIQYHKQIDREVATIRERVEEELLATLAETPDKELSPLEASLLSQMFADNRTLVPESGPFFIHIGTYGYIYEKLLREKMGGSFSTEVLYQVLQKNFKSFLIAQTATSDLLLDAERVFLFGADYWENSEKGTGTPFTLETLDYSHLSLDENNVLRVTPEGIEAMHQFVKEKKPIESLAGRTEERGCPVLYARNRDAIYEFGVREYIAQHKIAYPQSNN
jgi:hypothetical protein